MSWTEADPHRRVDVRDKVCPHPTMEVQKALDEMERGETLEVVSNFMPGRGTIPFLCWRQGFPWKLIEDGDGQFRVLIKKEEGDPAVPRGYEALARLGRK